jgi:UDP-N-acetylmuramyl pentapeptide synthase
MKSLVVYTLTVEARRVLHKWKPTIIVVSGSVGKTTTKDAIYHVLQESWHVRKSQKSFNSEIGVPLTILGLENAWSSPIGWLKNIWRGYHMLSIEKNYPATLVLEVGSDHPNDIARLMSWIVPSVAVVTSLPDVPVHVEHFSSPEEIRHEDGLVVGALRDGGVYVANVDDTASMELVRDAEKRNLRVVRYGFGKDAVVRGSRLGVRYALNEGVRAPVGMEFYASFSGEEYPVYVNGVLGVGACTAILAALAVAVALDEPFSMRTSDMVSFEPPPGRMRIIAGKMESTIIDDSYNSSPIALASALHALRGLEARRRIAMLGDMLELGSFSDEEHWKAGRMAGEFVDELITVGARARLIAEAAKSAGLPEGRIHQFTSAVEAGNFMKSILGGGDVILVKGSQGSGANTIRMERAVKILMAHPDQAPHMLVRQESAWQD